MSTQSVIGFDYLPYGIPSLENIDQYYALFGGLTPEQQFMWTTRFIDKTSDADLATVTALVQKMGTAPNFKRMLGAVKKAEYPGELTAVRIRLSTCWHNVTYTAIVNKTDTEDSLVELGRWILNNHYPRRAELYKDSNPLSITIEKALSLSDVMCLHVSEHGNELGFYQSFTLYPTDDFANEFFPMTTRKAMIDNFLVENTAN